jgi:LuxR family maltose regulon positive regulatory protein
VSDYVESEFLARISRRQRVFLTRTAVLERMSGPLCEAVMSTPGAAATLADLAGSNMLLVPLDRRAEWYRYHHLFRDMLLAQLHRQEPALMPVLRRRAARWCLRNDLPEEALEYSIAAGDVNAAARLWRNWGFRRTGGASSLPSRGGSGGCRIGAGSKGIRWPPCWPGCSSP